MVSALESYWRRWRGSTAVDSRIRKTLVDTLYARPSSLIIGACNGVATSSVGAYVTQDRTLTLLTAVLLLVAVFRIALGLALPKMKFVAPRRMEVVYEIGAFAFSGLTGIIAAYAILMNFGTAIQLMLLANAAVYGVGIAARNAGRPVIAIGQLCLSLLPVVAACVYVGSLPLLMTALGLLLCIPAMVSIIKDVFDVLKRSITAAETSRRLADKMEKLARTDIVTGLLNRAGLNHHLTAALMDIANDRKLALVWVDLDRFKFVNDTLGHQVGDKVLANVARRLREEAPGTATIARFGGDEFIVAFEADRRDEVEKMAVKLLDALTRPYRFRGERIEIGASMGIAMLPDDASDLEPLLQAADLALYHAKVNGRNQMSFYHPSMNRDLVRRREIVAELRQAVQRDELSIFFQPIVDLETGRIRCFEALVRWFHPEKGEMRPDEFIPVAEETGAIVTLGNWILAQAAQIAAHWPEHVTLAVNLSPLQIRTPGAALGILAALKEAGLDPHRLELEITESVLVDHDQTTEAFIAELSQAGVRFALDDFGTGYSSLAYLHKYPFGKIKVDRSFVSGSHVGKKSEAIIRAVSEMGSTLEMEIVAEGIETIEQVRTVREAGCTLGQGYYFSRAVPDYLATMLLAREQQTTDQDQRVAS